MAHPDVVVVCCGGGGLLAGVAAAIKLSGCDNTRIYGVEPEGGEHSKLLFCGLCTFDVMHVIYKSSME